MSGYVNFASDRGRQQSAVANLFRSTSENYGAQRSTTAYLYLSIVVLLTWILMRSAQQ